MTSLFRRDPSKKTHPTRLRIFIWALIISAAVGFLSLTEPLEDIYRGGRNYLQAHSADRSVVVVAIDDRTVRELGSINYSRTNDAKLVETLLARGVRRIYYDKIFADQVDPAGDAEFANILAKHRGQVFLGATFLHNRNTGIEELVAPTIPFSQVAEVRSLTGRVAPFSLSADLFYSSVINGKIVPGIAADIAGLSDVPGTSFRPDWSIRVRSIPTLSYVDVIKGRATQIDLAGKDIVVGNTNIISHDWLQVAGQDWFPAVYVHAIGAQTLREGRPISLGWLPAFFAAILFTALLFKAQSRRRATVITLTTVGLGIAVPFVLDAFLINADYIPAYLLFGISAIRATSHRDLLEASLRNAGTLMPNLSALREEPLAATKPVVAMRIRNYAAIGASFAEPAEDDLVSEVARRLNLPGEQTIFYQAEDVLYWVGPQLPATELVGHIEGLARLIESQFVIRERKIDIYLAFGIDMDFARPIANRIGRALLAADNAAANQKLMMFNSSANDADSAWELSLMSELDAAIDDGDIWIAYQPQFNLRDNRITGAEALVRWQHPTRGAISPEAFILPAEEHNRISKLTFHILDEATRAIKHIVALDPQFRLSVNISANLLQQPELPELITQALARTGFPASNLTLEVTESAPFKEHELVKRNLAGIAAAGIDLSIDDYGTGNATLEYMRSVPCKEIKIDRRFISGLVANASDLLLVESTIELAHGLGRRVIAEGIENPETLELLRTLGCDIAQGYYLAKPMRIAALEALLQIDGRIQAA
jgi:EAL domain-containing protein (putative c-di-GMP-specific phosphodiesterase class I)/CHASE2 domain-containing sensor protein